MSVDTRIVPKEEFDRMVGYATSSKEKLIEKTVYVIKPILVPHGTLNPKKLTKTQRQWRIYN